MSSNDTIYALATPPAKSGVAIMRLSGRLALSCLATLCKQSSLEPRHAYYASFFDPVTGDLMDRGVAIYFKAPNSFTGEDVVELHLHGSIAVIKQLQHVLSQMHGLRPAEAGEFSRRAFLNGRMDLMEAEGLADLIDAETSQQKSQALRQMQGELSQFYDTVRNEIITCLAQLEAYIDFPDEEIPESVLQALKTETSALARTLRDALEDNRRGERVRDGITIAILGAPNVGKSSLLNRTAKRDAAIVSQRAGTTRDVIEVHLDIKGYPVILVDTAGIRESDDDIEREGIRRALERAGKADIKLVLFDGSSWPVIDDASKKLVDGQAITIINKCDLIDPKNRISNDAVSDPVFVSTTTGEGMDTLMARLEEKVVSGFSTGQGCFITRERHRALLAASLQCLEKSLGKQPLELKCEELRQAALAIGKITGKIQVDDVLDVIFKRFCIGK